MTTISKFTTPGAAGVEADARATQYVSEHQGVTYREAINVVLRADNLLAEAYAAPASRVVARKPIARPAPVPVQMSQGSPAGYEAHLRAEKLVQEHPSLDYRTAVRQVLDKDRQLKARYAGVQR